MPQGLAGGPEHRPWPVAALSHPTVTPGDTDLVAALQAICMNPFHEPRRADHWSEGWDFTIIESYSESYLLYYLYSKVLGFFQDFWWSTMFFPSIFSTSQMLDCLKTVGEIPRFIVLRCTPTSARRQGGGKGLDLNGCISFRLPPTSFPN